jgi:hypothetical protein
MTPAQTYRMYAGIAADIAADNPDPGRRVSLLEMAQAWRVLADKEDGPPVVQQQQQQPQSNDNEKKE